MSQFYSKVLLVSVEDGLRGLGDVPVVFLQDVEGRLLGDLQLDALLVVDLVDEPDDLDGQVDVPARQRERWHADVSVDGATDDLSDDSNFVKIFAADWIWKKSENLLYQMQSKLNVRSNKVKFLTGFIFTAIFISTKTPKMIVFKYK